ncbi:MAG: ATP-binding protein [Myxococcota bacterium]|jgi:hypothetical protein|nr:ATP-binding protein [Myxococcota bacterium]
MKKLPIGIQTFETLIRDGYYYADKTPFIHELANSGVYYFLSRPRRFGKSLFLSTLRAAYEGKRELFEGLFLADHWDWSKRHPVVHLSFGLGVHRSVDELRGNFAFMLDEHFRRAGLVSTYPEPTTRFAELIRALFEQSAQRVVLLVDEYDKPILDNIEQPDLAAALRDELKSIYSVIKDSDSYLELVFLTGVSKFSKVSLFSGLNNLEDLTLAPHASAICGYTQAELEEVFAERLVDVDLARVKAWYDGYRWLGESVYNPFDILLFLKSKVFRSYWFETGTPSFLVKALRRQGYPMARLEELVVGEEIASNFELEDLSVEALLFQAGYLTIEAEEQLGAFRRYRMGYPNLEVKASLANAMLTELTQDRLAKTETQSRLLDALLHGEPAALEAIFRAFFASIPHDWYRKNELAAYEAYYASVFYCYFSALGLDVRAEDSTSHGRIDLSVRLEKLAYVFEFKLSDEEGSGAIGLAQIKAKGYQQKFMDGVRRVFLVGVSFDKKSRNITHFAFEQA